MDDFIVTASTADELIDRVEKVFKTLKFRNLRLKGKKCLFFSKVINLLGRRVQDGRICMADNILSKAIAETPEIIVTIKMLKRYIGILNYLSIGMPRCTEIMVELNDAAAGKKLAEKVNWTPALKAAYEKVAKTINSQMLDLFPIEKTLPTRDANSPLLVATSVRKEKELIKRMKTYGNSSFIRDRNLICELQLESKILKRAISAKEKNGQMPGHAWTLRTSTFLCSKGTPKILRKRKIMVGTRICEPVVIPEEFAEISIRLFHKGNCGTQTSLINIAKCEIWCPRLYTLIDY